MSNIIFKRDLLLLNGGFETAGGGGADVFADWVENAGSGAIAAELTLVNSGSNAAKLTQGASLDAYIDQTKTVVAGDTEELRLFTRGDGSNAGRYSIYDITNAADIIAITATGISGTTYTQIVSGFTVPSGCTQIRIRLHAPAVSAAVAYFDDVELFSKVAFLKNPVYGLGKPLSFRQPESRSDAGDLYIYNKGLVEEFFEMSWKTMRLANWLELKFFYRYIAIGKANSFIYYDEYGTAHTVRFNTTKIDFRETRHELYSGALKLRKVA